MLSIAAQIAKLILTVGSTAALARLLSPDDFGLIGTAMALIAVAQTFRDLGLSTATVQAPRLSLEQVSNLLWINILASLVLAVLLSSLAAPFAAFVGDARVAAVVSAYALLLLPTAAAAQHLATLQRELRFRRLLSIDLASQVALALVSIAAAVLGAGYWSLFYGAAASAIGTMALAWLTSGWIPTRPRLNTGVWPMLRFGAAAASANLIYVAAKDLDKILISRLWGVEQVGFYSRAQMLTTLPTQVVSGGLARAAIPALAASMAKPDEFRRIYLSTTMLLGLLAMPAAAFMLVSADSIVTLVLGTAWSDTVPVFRALSVGALLHPIASTNSWLYMSLGRARANLIWIVANVPMLLGAIAIGLPWGAVGVATSYSAYLLLSLGPCMYFATRNTPVGMRDVGAAARAPIVTAVAIATGAALGGWILPGQSAAIEHLICQGVFALAACLPLLAFRRFRKDLEWLRAARRGDAI